VTTSCRLARPTTCSPGRRAWAFPDRNTALQFLVSRGRRSRQRHVFRGEVIPDGRTRCSRRHGGRDSASPSGIRAPPSASRAVPRDLVPFLPSTSGYYEVSTCAGDGSDDLTTRSFSTSHRRLRGAFTSCEQRMSGRLRRRLLFERGHAVHADHLSEAGQEVFISSGVWLLPPLPGDPASSPHRSAARCRPPREPTRAGSYEIPASGPFLYLTPLVPTSPGPRAAATRRPVCSLHVASVSYKLVPTAAGRFAFSVCADCPTERGRHDHRRLRLAGGCADRSPRSGATTTRASPRASIADRHLTLEPDNLLRARLAVRHRLLPRPNTGVQLGGPTIPVNDAWRSVLSSSIALEGETIAGKTISAVGSPLQRKSQTRGPRPGATSFHVHGAGHGPLLVPGLRVRDRLAQ